MAAEYWILVTLEGSACPQRARLVTQSASDGLQFRWWQPRAIVRLCNTTALIRPSLFDSFGAEERGLHSCCQDGIQTARRYDRPGPWRYHAVPEQ